MSAFAACADPRAPVPNSARLLVRTSCLSSRQAAGKPWGDAELRSAGLPPDWQARCNPPPACHPEKRNQPWWGGGRINLPVFPLPTSPSAQGTSERTVKVGSVGEASLKTFHVIFCFKFRKVRNCLLKKNSYQKTFPLPLDCGRWGERGEVGEGENWVLT